MPRTLTLAEAADMLKVHVDTVSDLIRRQGLPAARFGRAYVLMRATARHAPAPVHVVEVPAASSRRGHICTSTPPCFAA